MSKFCIYCGKPLKEGAKFCAGCGKPVTIASPETKPVLKKCPPFEDKSVSEETLQPKVKAMSEEVSSKTEVPVLKTTGEFDLPIGFTPFSADVDWEGLLSVLQSGMRGIMSGFKRTLGDKKRLAIAITLTGIWLLVNVLAALGIFTLPVRSLSWLTAARGSLIGGTIGKGLVAALLAQIITNKEMLQNMKDDMGQLTVLVKGSKKFYSSLLLGMGAALIACNMMVSSNLQNTMVSIAAFVLSLRTFTRNGFLRQLITSFLPKAKDTFITSIMGGWTLGFAVFTAISFLPGGEESYLLGFMLLVIGGILEIMNKNKKEVATK